MAADIDRSGSQGAAKELTYIAAVSECAGIGVDPATCLQTHSPLNLRVDADDAQTGAALHTFLRVDLDDRIAKCGSHAVELRMHTTTDGHATSSHSGEVWEVGSFSVSSLASKLPQWLQQLASGKPDMIPDAEVVLPLPGLSLAADQTLYLGLRAIVDNGTNYWHRDGPHPPLLVVTCQSGAGP